MFKQTQKKPFNMVYSSNDNLYRALTLDDYKSGNLVMKVRQLDPNDFVEGYASSVSFCFHGSESELILHHSLRDAMFKWCDSNIRGGYTCNGYRFFFVDSNDAMLFKLAWSL